MILQNKDTRVLLFFNPFIINWSLYPFLSIKFKEKDTERILGFERKEGSLLFVKTVKSNHHYHHNRPPPFSSLLKVQHHMLHHHRHHIRPTTITNAAPTSPPPVPKRSKTNITNNNKMNKQIN